MSLRQFRFCPVCKAELSIEDSVARCSACQFIHYENPAPGAGIVPIKDGQALIAIRAVDPFKGAPDPIGGFMQAGETPEETALRELKEESGLVADSTDLLGIYPDTYGPGGKPTLVILYTGRITGGKLRAGDDVAELHWVPIADLPLNQGFWHVQQAFRDLQKLHT